MSSKTMDKVRLFKALQTERKRLEALLSEVTEAQMIQPGVEGNWSVKDLLAHIAVWDKRGTLWIKTAAEGKVPAIPEAGAVYHPKEWARLNQLTYQENRERALSEILQDFQTSYQQLLKQFQELKEADLSRSFQMGADVITIRDLIRWRYLHWQSHSKNLRAWRVVAVRVH